MEKSTWMYQLLSHTTMMKYSRTMMQQDSTFTVVRCKALIRALKGKPSSDINKALVFEGQEFMENHWRRQLFQQ
eukprot:1451952-Amphidinium_carterae.7